MGNQNQNASNNQSTLQQPIKFEFRWLELKRQKCGVKKKKKRNWPCGVNGAIFADVCTFFI